MNEKDITTHIGKMRKGKLRHLICMYFPARFRNADGLNKHTYSAKDASINLNIYLSPTGVML